MKLILTQGWSGTEQHISDAPTAEEVSKLLNTLDWQEFNSIQLEKDSKNWINVSGNLKLDGLAILYEEDGVQFVSDEAPESISTFEEVLTLYLKEDSRFKNLGFSSELEITKPKLKKETNYDLWKIKDEAKQKVEKRNRLISIFISLTTMFFLGSVFYLWYTDELKFVGYKTDHITATVSSIEWRQFGRGYVQHITYQFEYDGQQYEGHFTGNKFTGKHEEGDLVKVKFALDKPSISKRVATYKRKPKSTKNLFNELTK